jgi:DNA repair exonuclease SbcCD ATPase subunit
MDDLSVVNEIKSLLTEAKDKLKSDDLSSEVFTQVSNNAKLLQNKLDELLNKKGLYTQSDVNDAYLTIQEYKRKELELMSKKSKNKLILYSALGVLVVVVLVKVLNK